MRMHILNRMMGHYVIKIMLNKIPCAQPLSYFKENEP